MNRHSWPPLIAIAAMLIAIAPEPRGTAASPVARSFGAPRGAAAGLADPPLPASGAGELRAAAVPNDELYEGYQWYLRQIRAPEAWDITTGSASTVIAILDTGVSLTHPDLESKLLAGYDFVNDDTVPEDDHGNGTHVAGIAAAVTNNGVGVAGIAWQARIMPIKVLDASARGDASRAAQGVIYAVDRGARIINLGLSGPSPSQVLQDAIDYAYTRGALVIAPVGNDGTAEPSYPAAGRNVLAVAATDRMDRKLPSSNTGDYISVAAPGEGIGSTFKPPGGANGYAIASTTAQAAAQVAGLAALLIGINPSLSPDELRRLIESTADDVGPRGRDAETGFGRINAGRAVQVAAPWNYLTQGAGSYTAPARPQNTLYFPLIMKDANGWNTSFTIQNPARFSTSLRTQFVDTSGRVVHTITTTLPASGSITYQPSTVAELPRGFLGSAVARADVPITGVVNEDHVARDRLTYEGVSGGASTLWVPLLMKDAGGWSTGLQVQNLGSAPTEVRVRYYTRGEATPLTMGTLSLPPSTSQTLYQPSNDRIPSEWVGSAVVDSADGQPVAAIVNQVHLSGLGMSYVGIEQPGPVVYAPLLFKSSGGWNTGLQVQNAGTVASPLQATFSRTNGDGGPWSEAAMVAPGGSATFYQPANADLPDDFVGAGVVRASGSQALGGIVNEVRYDLGMAMAYDTPTEGVPTVYVPLVYREWGGWNSGIQVQNLGRARTMVTITFYGQDGVQAASMQQAVESETSITAYLPEVRAIASNFAGNAVVSSSGDQPIAAIVNHVKIR